MVSPIKVIRGTGSRGATEQRGFTYLMLLLWVVIAGVMLAALGTSWSLMARREREAELVWRGEQYQRALASYMRAGVALQAAASAAQAQSPVALADSAGASQAVAQSAQAPPVLQGPLELKDLLEDHRSGKLVRHLRRLYPDPITGSRWGLQRSADGRITGLYSLSDAQPLRRSLGVESYHDLVFSSTVNNFAAPASAASGAATGSSPSPNGFRN